MALLRFATAAVLFFCALSAGAIEVKTEEVKAQGPVAVPATAPLAPLAGATLALVPEVRADAAVEPPFLPPAAVVPEAGIGAAILTPTAAAAQAGFSEPSSQDAKPAKPEVSVESSVEPGRRQFDLSGGEDAQKLNQAPAFYRREVAQRGVPKVRVTGVLSREGGSAVLLGAEFNGRRIAVKTYKAEKNENWPETLKYFHNEILMAQAMHRVLGPKGMAPEFYGEVDIGEKGNPSWGMGIIDGKDPHLMTPAEAKRFITPESIRQTADGIRLLREAGLGGGDSPQPMILTRDQLINEIPRKTGDVVFMDPGGLHANPKRWKTPEDEARYVAFLRLEADLFASTQPNRVLDGTPLTQAQLAYLQKRARALVASILKQ